MPILQQFGYEGNRFQTGRGTGWPFAGAGSARSARSGLPPLRRSKNSLLVVVKNDGRRESFDRNKLINGLLKACEKTKITYEDVEKIAERIERALNNTMEKEIESKMIGALIMDELRNLDQVAYVRFASVYHKFTDVNTFVQEVNRLQEKDRVRPEERNEEK